MAVTGLGRPTFSPWVYGDDKADWSLFYKATFPADESGAAAVVWGDWFFDGAASAPASVAAFAFDDEVVSVMRKNVASQVVAGQMNDRGTGAPLTASVSVFVTGDGGAQSAGGGTLTHEGNGHWTYVPTQAETNFNHVAFTFTHASGVHKTYNIYTVSYDTHDTAGLGLSRVDVAVSTRLPAASYTAPDNATISSIQSDTNDIQARLPAALVGGRMASNAEVVGDKAGYGLTSAERDAIATAMIDLVDAIETGMTPRQALRVALAVLAGKVSGASGTTVTFRNAAADSKDRIVATVDSDGNRSAVTLDLT